MARTEKRIAVGHEPHVILLTFGSEIPSPGYTSWRQPRGSAVSVLARLKCGAAIADFRSMAARTLPHHVVGAIRRKLDNGDLPTKAPLRLDVHRGAGVMCDACGARIRTTDLEHEFIYPNHLALHLHFECAAYWVALCRQRGFALVS